MIRRVRELLPAGAILDRGLDVGCGIGLSTVALKQLTKAVVGVDASAVTIHWAAPAPGIVYRVDAAEQLRTCGDCEFDIVTLAQVIHRVDLDRFMVQAHRVMRTQSWLVVYEECFTGRSSNRPDFLRWYRDKFVRRYPPSLRTSISFEQEALDPFGFQLVHQEVRARTVNFPLDELVDFLLTRSGVAAQVERGHESLANVREWLVSQLHPFFESEGVIGLVHKGPLWLMRRRTPADTGGSFTSKRRVRCRGAVAAARSGCSGPSEMPY